MNNSERKAGLCATNFTANVPIVDANYGRKPGKTKHP